MADPKPQSRQTYSEAMAEWAALHEAQRALFSKSRNTLLTPDPLGSPLVRFFGWVWRLGALAAIALVGYYITLQWYLRSPGFSGILANGATEYLAADKVTLLPLSWRGDKGVTRRLSVVGGPTSPFRSLEAEDVQFKLPMAMILGKKWDLPTVSIGSLSTELRSGALGKAGAPPPLSQAEKERLPDGAAPVKADLSVPTLSDEAPSGDLPKPSPTSPPNDTGKGRPLDLRLKRDGFGIAPDFSQIVVSQFDIGRANISWGGSPITRGAIDGSAVVLRRLDTDRWQLDAAGGTLRQNWLKDLAINKLSIAYNGRSLDFTEADLALGPAGKASLTGRVFMESNPRLDLRISGEHLPLTQMLPDAFAKIVRLNGSMDASIGGSPNIASGIATSGILKISSGSLRELPIFDTLAIVTGRTRFRDIEITGGTVKFSTQGGVFEAPEFAIQSRNDIMVQGTIRAEGQLVAGNLYVGMSSELAQRVPEPLRKAFFRESDGWLILPIPLDGRIEQLTKDLSTRLATAFQALPR